MQTVPKKIDVAGLKVDAISKSELLEQIASRIQNREKTFIATPYSEFLFASMRRPHIRALLNRADLSIVDGVGVLWAHLFLDQKLSFKNFYLNVLQAWGQVVWTGASILLHQSLLYKDIPEKITGADLAWDLAKLAAEHNFSIYILGGFDDTAKIVAEKFLQKYPNLRIAGTSNKHHNDSSIFSDVHKSNADMLLVGLGPITQEQWIVDNLKDLPASFAIGLGGTFDYIAGAKRQPPRFVRAIGLEWLYRLVTQPSRLHRIINATWGLILSLVRYKVHNAKPWRPNAIAVVLNNENKILLCKRPPRPYGDGSNPNVALKDYWQFPQGGLDKKENAEQGARRELLEETGMSSVHQFAEAKYKNYYTWNNATRKLFFPLYREYKGPMQITIFYKFTGEDSEIKLNPDVFDEFAWFTPQQILAKVAAERRPHAQAVLAELAEIQVN
ncbi:MAG TPA: WecB/TagA/CpsF family glycosyltransferase [Patescibacteria group bacterium]|jgi:N-acetylglucosaminyldiphosphoundecaprenol N-acetyl-beta-D-mannosaminyltransferase|nr:WecB/TagA/CpsF family glycosyltransferase [Patescibacteria group bacterium]